MPVIPATQETEIRRIVVQSQARPIVCETLSQRIPVLQRERKREKKRKEERKVKGWAQVAHICNPNDSRVRDQKKSKFEASMQKSETLSQKYSPHTHTQKRTSRVSQVVLPSKHDFEPQCHKK
jgi:hypothetical protein